MSTNAKLLKSEQLLKFVGTVQVSASICKFVTRKKFVINIECNTPVKIHYFNDNFNNWFLKGNSKIEGRIKKHNLHYYQLRRSIVDGHIIEELGGKAKVETTLSDIFFLMENMEKQKNNVDAVPLDINYVHIFYVKDQKGVLHAIYMFWSGIGWKIYANLVGSTCGLYDGAIGIRVYSCDSVIGS